MVKEKTAKKWKDPERPKRGMSAFFFFSKAVRAQVREENPQASMKDVAVIIGSMWKQIAEHEKIKYMEEAEKDKERYMKEMQNYKPPQPPKHAGGKRKKDPNAPKRAMSAFMFFSNNIRPTLMKENPSKKITEIAKLIGELWGKRTDDEFKKYQAMADEDKLRYAKDLEAYNHGDREVEESDEDANEE